MLALALLVYDNVLYQLQFSTSFIDYRLNTRSALRARARTSHHAI